MTARLFLSHFMWRKGFEQGVKKQSGGLFFSRGNEQSEAIGAGAPGQNPFQRANEKEMTVWLFLSHFMWRKGFEQGVKKQSGGLFFSRGNEQSEAIGAGAPGQNPFKSIESPIKSIT